MALPEKIHHRLSETRRANQKSEHEDLKNLLAKAGVQFRMYGMETGHGGFFFPTALVEMDQVIESLPIPQGRPVLVLEPGQGQGIISLKIAKRYPNVSVVGIEGHSDLCQESKKLLTAAEESGWVEPGRVQFFSGNFNSPPYRQIFRAADLIYYFMAGADETEFVQTLAESMKEGAKIVEYGLGTDTFEKELVGAGLKLRTDTVKAGNFPDLKVYTRLPEITS